jgi:PAS domain S-box-containing protein
MHRPNRDYNAFNPWHDPHVIDEHLAGLQSNNPNAETTAKLLHALLGTPVIVFAQDLDLRYTWIHNPTTGLTINDIIGKQDRDIFDCAEEVRRLEYVKRCTLTTGTRQRIEITVKIREQRRCYDIICTPSRNHHDLIDGIVCTAIDVTEQVEGRTRLERNNERLNLAVAALNGYIYEQSLKTGDTERGDGIVRILGYTADDIQNRSDWWINLIHPADRDKVRQTADREWREHQGHSLEYRVRHKLGHYIHVWDRAIVVNDEHGQPDRLIGTAIDISAQKMLQERQRFLSAVSKLLAVSLDLEQTLDHLVRIVLPDFADLCVIFLTRTDGRIERAATAHVDPAIEQRLRELHQSDSIDPHGPHLAAQTMRERRPLLYPPLSPEIIDETRSPEFDMAQPLALVPCSQIVVPLIAREHVIGAIFFGVTVSERIYNEHDVDLAQELADRAALSLENARLYREAQEAVRMRDAFLSIASHELRTPLTILMGQIQLLERRLRASQHLDPRNDRSITTVVNQAGRLNKLISALLDVSRLERDQLQLDVTSLDLRALLQQLVEVFRLDLMQHTLNLHVPDDPVIIPGDELRLEQVFQNLIQNAIKYSPAGGNIEVHLGRHDRHAVVSIRDEGIGIPAADLSSLFSRFFRAGNVATKNIGGVGIGLFVVREIVQLHGGHIDVDSIENAGSTFTVSLPVAEKSWQ